MKEDLRVVDKIRGRIISVSESVVFVDTGTKTDGVVEIEELRDEEGNLPHAVGDELELFVVAANEGEIRLSRAIAGAGGLEMLKDAFAGNIPVEGRVQQTIKGGFQVEVLKRRAFCPISKIDTQYVEDGESYVGQTFQFLIKKLTENGRNIVVSRRDLLEAEQKTAHDAFLKDLVPEQTYDGRVTRLMPFGAFVELIPGLEGMVHISELGWSRVEKPEDVVQPDQTVRVKVLGVAAGKKGPKIALSIKQVQGDPWDRLPEDLEPGRKINGKVMRCTNFGAFVEIVSGIEGLVHISELSYTQRVHRVEDVVQPGQTISVVIKEVDTHKRRIGLSLRDAEGDPWLEVDQKFKAGQAVSGTVEKREKFGIFVQLMPGVVGLLPKSNIAKSAGAARFDTLKPGDAINTVVENINAADRRISLKPGDAQEPEKQDWKSFAESNDSGSMGALGEQLAKAFKKKE
ncbi:MAG: 30S ribosomal protein S1 [Desulfatitalea sp.]|nr:30S ribosomal protein S1 [Desulfatitalea sp.]NNK00594.1 30S ribosomal protein S1 [Desulfatitalea sp.]